MRGPLVLLRVCGIRLEMRRAVLLCSLGTATFYSALGEMRGKIAQHSKDCGSLYRNYILHYFHCENSCLFFIATEQNSIQILIFLLDSTPTKVDN